jgi:hypothetical protein
MKTRFFLRLMLRPIHRFGSALLASSVASLMLSGCGSGEDALDIDSRATPTAVGEAQGEAASAQIGAAGGALTSTDGRLTLTVPAGAFTSEQQVRIEPISNNAHGGKGTAYRISPEGLNTPVAMTLTFTADAASLRGSALGALTIATQDAGGRWLAWVDPQRNASTRTISIQTHHFSDWAIVAGVQLYPVTAQVAVNQSLDLKVIRCPRIPDPGTNETVYVGDCVSEVLPGSYVDGWAVNGVIGGGSASGTIGPVADSPDDKAAKAYYAAPAAVPAVNPVAISVDYQDKAPGSPQLQLVSNVTIVPGGGCGWLHGAKTLSYEIEMQYSFAGSGPLGVLALEQRGLIIGEMTQLFDGEQYGTWRGLTTQGSANLSDQHTFGDTTTRLVGNGAPALGTGIDDNQLSAATLVVDYQNCTYTITGQVAVLATSGADAPRPRNVAGFTRGNLPIELDSGLVGREDMRPRLQPDAAGTYFPGGLGIGLVGDGYATETTAGTAQVRWTVTR